jgi:hypothetical protein
VQQPLKIDSLYSAAMQADFAAKKNTASSFVNKNVFGEDAAKVITFFELRKGCVIFCVVCARFVR